MKILLYTRFYPKVGGMETVASLLAHEWVRAGEEITLVSDVACPPKEKRAFPFSVIYQPGAGEWIKWMRWSDLYLQFNARLRGLWPCCFVRRPVVFSHHSGYWISRAGGRHWRDRLKLWLADRTANIHASQAIARETALPGEVIPNPYDDTIFNQNGAAVRDRELVFVGRLISDKGADLLLNALGQLQSAGVKARLTLIGDGPERPALEEQTKRLKLEEQVFFAGVQPPEQVAELLRCHEILVVPSLWKEPFGVVALEGAACGCVVLGSDGGGLPEAIGSAGITFQRGDVDDLVSKLSRLLQHPDEWNGYRAAASAHLAKHQPRKVAARYLEIFQKVLNHGGKELLETCHPALR